MRLVAWAGLTAADAARVAGCSTHAFEVRLQRARARLRRELDEERGTGHTTPIRTVQEVPR
jgi:RNA polymerase sigma-70 factor (ECF subfamily)